MTEEETLEEIEKKGKRLPVPFKEQDEPEGDTEFDSAHQKEVDELNPKFRLIVEKVAYQIATEGLTLEEACLIKNIDYKWFLDIMDKRPVVARIIQKKELEYKRDMMRSINRRARSGDEKLAQWLLLHKFPEEFGTKRKVDTQDDDDMLEAAIRHIQDSGDSTTLVQETSAVAFVKTKKSISGSSIVSKIEDILK